MAYFDDPDHRAVWEKELNQLREEKQSRKSGQPLSGDRSLAEPTPEKQAASVKRRENRMYSGRSRITFQELKEKEYGKEKPPKLSRSVSREKEHTMTKSAGGKGR